MLDSPATKNALTPAAVRAMIDAIETTAVQDGARAVLIGSTGDDFCAGADVVAANRPDGERPRTGNLQRRTALEAHRLIELIMSVQVPVVCAVKGWAAGLGFQLAIAADFTVAATDASFWEPFVARGFTPDSGATWLLPRIVGLARTKQLLMLATHLDGTAAEEWGLIHQAVPAADVDTVAAELAATLAAGATVALGLTKACVHSALTTPLGDAMAKEALALELSSRSADFREGMAAFAQRRPPVFEGR